MPEFKSLRLRGRDISSEVLQFIRQTIVAHGREGRAAIVRRLCAHWNWRQHNGGLKDMACRDLLLRHERLGLIQLPPRQSQKANYRFLILPWIRVQHLASPILALSARRLLLDWQSVFAEELCLLETFVDRSRFHGTCYKAANWLDLGQTKGSAKRAASYHRHGLAKTVLVYPLRPDFRARLCL